MLSVLCVRLTIKVKVEIPESFKVGWYPPQKNWVKSPSGNFTCSFEVKTHAVHKNRAPTKIQQQHIVLVINDLQKTLGQDCFKSLTIRLVCRY